MAYRTFTRTWWQDKACTIPGAGRKQYREGDRYNTEEEAREACKTYNIRRFGPSKRGPRGLAMEFEEA